MSGGKGGKTTTKVELPKELADAARKNLAVAEKVGQVGYVPYIGPTIAALAPEQQAAMQNNAAAAGAFGMQGSNISAAAGMPKVQKVAGGVAGYSPVANYNYAKSKISDGQLKAIQEFVINPKTGKMGSGFSSDYSSGTGSGTGSGSSSETGGKKKTKTGKMDLYNGPIYAKKNGSGGK